MGSVKPRGLEIKLYISCTLMVLGGSVHTIRKNTEVFQVAIKDTGLEVNAEKSKYMIMSREGMQDIIT
jgi:hypothetical protein